MWVPTKREWWSTVRIIDWNNLKIASTCHKNLDINKTQKYTQTKQKAMVSYCQILTEVVA